MTAVIWAASPPELHSVLLSSGPGPGPLLAAAESWRSLGAGYTAAAEELHQVLAAVRAGCWSGAAAESYTAAHAPYLVWLRDAADGSLAAAEQHRTVAGAYSAALITMPTPAELAANHTAHAALVATNFFGINTVPIAVNEADYAQLWLRAAAVMSDYQDAAHAAVVAVRPAAPAPPISGQNTRGAAEPPGAPPAGSNNPLQGLLNALEPLLKSLGVTDGPVAHDPMVANQLTSFIAHILQNFGQRWDAAGGTLNGHVYDYYSNAAEPIWYLARSLELFENFLQISQDPSQALRAVQYLAALALFDWPTHIAQFSSTASQGVAAAIMAAVPASTAGGLGGLAGLAGLADLPRPVAAVPAAVPAVTVALGAPAPGAPAAGAPPPPAATPPPPAAASAPAGVPPSAPGAAGFFPPYLLAPPGVGFGPGATSAARSGVPARTSGRARAPAADEAAVRTARQARTRRRHRVAHRGSGAEFMDMNAENSADTAVSDRGLDQLGFAGTLAQPESAASGLAAHGQLPLLPGTWFTDSGQHRQVRSP